MLYRLGDLTSDQKQCTNARQYNKDHWYFSDDPCWRHKPVGRQRRNDIKRIKNRKPPVYTDPGIAKTNAITAVDHKHQQREQYCTQSGDQGDDLPLFDHDADDINDDRW